MGCAPAFPQANSPLLGCVASCWLGGVAPLSKCIEEHVQTSLPKGKALFDKRVTNVFGSNTQPDLQNSAQFSLQKRCAADSTQTLRFNLHLGGVSPPELWGVVERLSVAGLGQEPG